MTIMHFFISQEEYQHLWQSVSLNITLDDRFPLIDVSLNLYQTWFILDLDSILGANRFHVKEQSCNLVIVALFVFAFEVN
jgi:hypothetical protein